MLVPTENIYYRVNIGIYGFKNVPDFSLTVGTLLEGQHGNNHLGQIGPHNKFKKSWEDRHTSVRMNA